MPSLPQHQLLQVEHPQILISCSTVGAKINLSLCSTIPIHEKPAFCQCHSWNHVKTCSSRLLLLALCMYSSRCDFSLAWGSPRFLARWLTLLGSACSIRPYSSQCSLSSAHAYPCRQKHKQCWACRDNSRKAQHAHKVSEHGGLLERLVGILLRHLRRDRDTHALHILS